MLHDTRRWRRPAVPCAATPTPGCYARSRGPATAARSRGILRPPLDIILCFERQGEIVMRRGIAGLKSNGGSRGLDRVVDLPLLAQRHAEVLVNGGEFGLHAERDAILANGLVERALRRQRQPHGMTRLRKIGPLLQCGFEHFHRFCVVALRGERHTGVVRTLGFAGLHVGPRRLGNDVRTRRPMAVRGTLLSKQPGCPEHAPESADLSGGSMPLRTRETFETVQRRRPEAQVDRGGYTHDRRLASASCALFPDVERADIAEQQITNHALLETFQTSDRTCSEKHYSSEGGVSWVNSPAPTANRTSSALVRNPSLSSTLAR